MKETPWLDLYCRLKMNKQMPQSGLCGNINTSMRTTLEFYFKPEWASINSFWGDEHAYPREFSTQRQNIVLILAAMNNEL